MSCPDLSAILEEGRRVSPLDGAIRLRRQGLGDLVVPSGRLVAGDPLIMADVYPLATAVPPGRYPVVCGIAAFDNGDERVAWALLQLQTRPVVRWEPATLPGQDPATLADGEFFGYGVDSGTGCFMDAVAAARLVAAMRADEEYYLTVIDAMRPTYRHTWQWASIPLDPLTGANLVAFSSGWGDGAYASYFGYDAAQGLTCLVTDFGLLDDAA
jgi:hypothetical protein